MWVYVVSLVYKKKYSNFPFFLIFSIFVSILNEMNDRMGWWERRKVEMRYFIFYYLKYSWFRINAEDFPEYLQKIICAFIQRRHSVRTL